MKIHLLPACVAAVLSLVQITAASKEDPFSANNNPKGSECYRKIAEVRKLESDPRFDTDKSIRQRWQRLIDEATRMKCKL